MATMNEDGEEKKDGVIYPWEDVEASRGNARLQARHSRAEGWNAHGLNAIPCPKCDATPDRLSWFYFSSPEETWKMLCGCEGWITVCDACHWQVEFFVDCVS